MIHLIPRRMPALTVRDISPELYERLKQRAEDNRRSMSAEILVILEESLMARRLDAEALRREALAMQEFLGRSFPEISKEDMREGLE